MTEPITDAEINALYSDDHKLMLRSSEASLSAKSTGGGSQRLSLTAGVGVPAAQACKFCRIQSVSGNDDPGRVRIGSTCTAITGVAIPGNPVLTPYSVSNLNLLNFFNTDQDAIYNIEYFD